MFKAGRGHISVEGFLAGKTKIFDLLVNSVGEGQVFDGLVRCFFPWPFLLETKLGPGLKCFSSIEIEPENKLEGCVVMEQVSKEKVSGVWWSAAC